MYIKIVVDNHVHYVEAGSEVVFQRGAASNGETEYPLSDSYLHILRKRPGGELITIFPDLPANVPAGTLPRTLITDGEVYLLDRSGKTVDVIQRGDPQQISFNF